MLSLAFINQLFYDFLFFFNNLESKCSFSLLVGMFNFKFARWDLLLPQQARRFAPKNGNYFVKNGKIGCMSVRFRNLRCVRCAPSRRIAWALGASLHASALPTLAPKAREQTYPQGLLLRPPRRGFRNCRSL
jgi:hypothetical protein